MKKNTKIVDEFIACLKDNCILNQDFNMTVGSVSDPAFSELDYDQNPLTHLHEDMILPRDNPYRAMYKFIDRYQIIIRLFYNNHCKIQREFDKDLDPACQEFGYETLDRQFETYLKDYKRNIVDFFKALYKYETEDT